MHFTPCILDPCLYHIFYMGERVHLTSYVDDIIILCANLIYMNERVCKKVDLSDVGELKFFLNACDTSSFHWSNSQHTEVPTTE